MTSIVRWVSDTFWVVVRNWNAIVGSIATLGILLFTFIPNKSDYVTVFAFMFANAVLWTLIEIRRSLLSSSESASTSRFDSMRDAREILLDEMCLQIVGPGTGNVTIVGGRIHSISELLRELGDRVKDAAGSSRSEGARFVIYCVDPDSSRSFVLPGRQTKEQQLQRGADYAATTSAAVRQIRAMGGWKALSDHGVTFECKTYTHLPYAYWYLFGDDCLLWGGYTYNPERSDIEGPSNPCYLLREGDGDFVSIARWLRSRTELLKNDFERRTDGDVVASGGIS